MRATDSTQRQRFSLAHEFGHIVSDPMVERMHAHLDPASRQEREEQLCNYFAACLLMPRPWVTHDWYGGIQTSQKLARRYHVSIEAMHIRLSELRLTPTSLILKPSNRHLEAAWQSEL